MECAERTRSGPVERDSWLGAFVHRAAADVRLDVGGVSATRADNAVVGLEAFTVPGERDRVERALVDAHVQELLEQQVVVEALQNAGSERIELAVALGASVIAASSDAKLVICRERGAVQTGRVPA